MTNPNSSNGPILEGAGGILPQGVAWLWKFWLVRRKLHILAGPPSTGKTTLALKVAATLTNGGIWPDGSPVLQTGSVVIWTCEDGIEDTIIPRLMACDANPDRVYILRVTSENGRRRRFDFARDLPRLDAKVRELGDVVLVIIDSIAQLVSGNSNSNSQVRKDLDPLVTFAEQANCAILGLTHVNKGSKKKDPLERVNGSTAIAALARLVWITACDESDRAGDGVPRSILVRAKSNLGPIENGLSYHVETVDIPVNGGLTTVHGSNVVFDELLEGTPKEILNDAEGGGASARDDRKQEAMNFLAELLANGPLPAETVQAQSGQAGMAWATMRRAAHALQVRKFRPMGDVKWHWELASGLPDTRGQHRRVVSDGASWMSRGISGSMFGNSLPAGSAPPSWGVPGFGVSEIWETTLRENREQVEQVEQHGLTAQVAGDIDETMWNKLVKWCLNEYRATPQSNDFDEDLKTREAVVDYVLEAQVVGVDDAWKARAKTRLMGAQFWLGR